MRAATRQYTAIAIVLHWAIAVAIIGNFGIGLWMHAAIEQAASQARAVAAYQLHKSIGLTVLLLSLLRLAWRLSHPPPSLPAHMPGWARIAAHATHWLFYLLMIAIPLSGWVYVSAQWRGDSALNVPTLWFGLFEVPHLFWLDTTPDSVRQQWSASALSAHELTAFASMLLLILHVAAAFKHQFADKDEVASRMIPALSKNKDNNPMRTLVLSLGLGAVLAASAAVAIALLMPAAANTAVAQTGGIGASADGWAIDPSQSAIAFAGSNAGVGFDGRFGRWQARLLINTDDPRASDISAEIETASASTGVALNDETLRETEWFDVANHPVAHYQTDRIEAEGNAWLLYGSLRIKQHAVDVGPLRLAFADGQARISGEVIVDRTAVDMGMASDPKAEWVSRDITVNVNVIATQRQ